MKLILAVLLGLFTMAPGAMAEGEKNYFSKDTQCLNKADLVAVQSDFNQFRKFTEDAGDQICAKDMGDKWLQIARSVLAMNRIDVDPIERDKEDDMTRRAIADKDWWEYFKKRANQFSIDTNCRPGVVAYVFIFGRGVINLCDLYFELDPTEQISVLMHEVRHFDGHRHVTCTRGNEKGSRGACDERITSAGSYAISVQTHVEMAFVDQLNPAQKALSEGSAIYTAINKFNRLPQVKSESYVYLSNDKGEIWRGISDELSGETLEKVAELESPAKIYSNGTAFTVYPTNVENDAYRVSKDFFSPVERIGAFAEKYNKETLEERAKYTGAQYIGFGVIAKENTLSMFCGDSGELQNIPFTQENIASLLGYGTGSDDDTTLVLGESGRLYQLSCVESSGKLKVKEMDITMPTTIASSFTQGENQFGVTHAGEVVSIEYSEGKSAPELMPVLNIEKEEDSRWLSATPRDVYSVFNNSEEMSVN